MERIAFNKNRIVSIGHRNFLKTPFASLLNTSHICKYLRPTCNSSLTSQSKTNMPLIKQEVSTYEDISQLYSDLIELQAIQQRIEYSKTLKGKYYHVLGHFFSLYCIWKIFISFVNIIFNRVGKGS
jgi:hypothetical protein